MAQEIKLIFGKTNTARVIPVTCTLDVPMEDGSTQRQTLKVACELLPEDEIDALYKQGGDKAILERIVKDFPGLPHEGETAPDFETAKKGLFAYPYIWLAILRDYGKARAGVLVKN